MKKMKPRPTSVVLGSILSIGIMLAGCASRIAKVEYPAGTDPVQEISQIENDLSEAHSRQTDVLSPRNFERAREHFVKAKRAQEKNEKPSEVLEQLGYSRAYLNRAGEIAMRGTNSMPEVLQARQDARQAQAQRWRSEDFREANENLVDVTEEFEDGDYVVSANKRAELQRQFLNVELAAIKTAQLTPIRALIEKAKKDDASRLAPKTLQNAEAKLRNAAVVIETNRHNEQAIQQAVDDARDEAEKLVSVVNVAKRAKKMTTEDVALGIVARNEQIAALDRKADAAQEREAATEGELVDARLRNQDLGKENTFNQAMADAQKMFSPEEAEVYRQGDSLVVRLKTLNFSSGRSDIPASALPLLSKARELVKEMGPANVVVEGHTDSLGSRDINVRLSQERADAIAQYLVTENAVSEDKIVARGLGYERPLTTNKTREGRAENRRVDLIVVPAQ